VHWLFSWQRLKRKGVLGINQRNCELLLEENPRSLHPLVDDKLKMHQLCARLQIPTPRIHAVVRSVGEQRNALSLMQELGEFVIKPVRGAAGRGIVIVLRAEDRGFERPNGKWMTSESMLHHLAELLSGMHSLGNRTDFAMIQERISVHPALERISYRGLPDIRVIAHRGEPIQAMLRLATLESNGRANLHQGGIGVGINLQTGRTTHGFDGRKRITIHPDTGEALNDRAIPDWPKLLDLASRVSRGVGLGFLGVDLVLDRDRGPLLLEANARPGLGIQLANRRGIVHLLKQKNSCSRETSEMNSDRLR
jgi:alpha-L-glutamate ligase-like protein